MIVLLIQRLQKVIVVLYKRKNRNLIFIKYVQTDISPPALACDVCRVWHLPVPPPVYTLATRLSSVVSSLNLLCSINVNITLMNCVSLEFYAFFVIVLNGYFKYIP